MQRLAFAFMLLGVAALAWARAHMLDVGTPAPNVELPLFGNAGRQASLDSLRGKVVLVDFWASWCGPCRQSFPAYEQLRRELPARDFAIFAINLDDMTDGPAAFLSEHPVGYTIVADPDGASARQYGLIGMPTAFLLDRDGVIRAHHIGFKPAEFAALQREIKELIAAPKEHADAP